jgi:uncharacterized membrane protein
VPRGHQVFFDHAHDHQGHPFLWLLLLVLFVALAGLAIYALLHLTRGGTPGASAVAGPDAAVESVRMRYARGEIDRDEFIRVATDLGAPPPAAAPG